MLHPKAFRTLVVVGMILNDVVVRCHEAGSGEDYAGAGRCAHDCGDYGECVSVGGGDEEGCLPTESEPNNCDVYECECLYGWDGVHCDIRTETCASSITTAPDANARQCFNGGHCETYTIMDPPEQQGEMGTRCNCQSLPTDLVAFAGHQCEYAAEQVCIRDAEHSTYAFCVNDGTCKELVDFNEEHPLCDCPSGFGGRHCQFVLTVEDGGKFELTPEDEIEYVNIILHGQYNNETKVLETTSNSSGLSDSMRFFVVVIVMFICIVGSCIVFVRRRRTNASSNATKTATAAGESGPNDSDWDATTNDDDANDGPFKNEVI